MAAEEVRVDGKESSTGIPHSKRYPVGEGLICHGSDHTINSAKGQKSERCSSVSDSRSLIATQHFDGKLRYKGQETRESPLVGKWFSQREKRNSTVGFLRSEKAFTVSHQVAPTNTAVSPHLNRRKLTRYRIRKGRPKSHTEARSSLLLWLRIAKKSGGE